MKKILTAAIAALSLGAFAATPVEKLDGLPEEIFIPAGAALVEGEDDGSGGIDLTVTTDAKVADVAAAVQAHAKDKGLTELSADVQEERAEIEVGKLGENNDPQAPEIRITYNIFAEDGKTQVEILRLK